VTFPTSTATANHRPGSDGLLSCGSSRRRPRFVFPQHVGQERVRRAHPGGADRLFSRGAQNQYANGGGLNKCTGSGLRGRAVRRKWYSGGCCTAQIRVSRLLPSFVATPQESLGRTVRCIRGFVAVRAKREELVESALIVEFRWPPQMQRRTTSHPGKQPGIQKEHQIELE
jgi:hypothetical protein